MGLFWTIGKPHAECSMFTPLRFPIRVSLNVTQPKVRGFFIASYTVFMVWTASARYTTFLICHFFILQYILFNNTVLLYTDMCDWLIIGENQIQSALIITLFPLILPACPESGGCSSGYEGRACAVCSTGYYRQDGVCQVGGGALEACVKVDVINSPTRDALDLSAVVQRGLRCLCCRGHYNHCRGMGGGSS